MPYRIVDSHQHFVELPGRAPEWLAVAPPPGPIVRVLGEDISPIRRTYLPADLASDVGPALVGAVAIEIGGAADSLEEARWLQGLADEAPYPIAVVPHADLEDPAVGERLEEYARLPSVRGVRQLLNYREPDLVFTMRSDYMRADDWRSGFARLARHDFVFDLQCFPQQLGDAADLARAFPDVQIVIDHVGMPVERDAAGVVEWRAAISPLHGCENITFKVCGFGMLEHAWSRDGIRPFVTGALELFGADRCMFATNFPVEGLFADARTIVADCEALCDELGLNEAEKDAFFAGTAERVYRL